MEISLDSIGRRDDPYQMFLDHFKNGETRRKYVKTLFRFLILVPDKIYTEAGMSASADDDVCTLARRFVVLAQADARLARNIIASYIDEEKKIVSRGEMSANTVPNHIKPIKTLLDVNGVPIHWKSLTGMYPRQTVSQDRAYTREELQQMIRVSPDITDRLVIQIFSSGGFRLEAWDYFTWKDVVFFKNDDGSYRGAALLVYQGDPESYWTFITPEACDTLSLYREKWKADIGRYP